MWLDSNTDSKGEINILNHTKTNFQLEQKSFFDKSRGQS